MDETANQMRDVRAQLRRAFERGGWTTGTDELVDIVLARFDVVERPVVTAKELGSIAMGVVYATPARPRENHAEQTGKEMLARLNAAGLTIVRVEGCGE